MAEGIRAVITADAKPFISSVNDAAATARRFKTAIIGATNGSLQFTPALNQAIPNLVRLNKQATVATKKFTLMKGATQQFGYQIQDIAVQLQGGQNALMVFGQQGSQIASIFGPGGAVVGAVLAVGAALLTGLIPALSGANKELESMAEVLLKLRGDLSHMSLMELGDAAVEANDKLESTEKALIAVNKAIALEDAGSFATLDKLYAKQQAITSDLWMQESALRSINAEQTKRIVTGGAARAAGEDPQKEAEERAAILQASIDQEVASETEKARLVHLLKANAFLAEYEQQQAWAATLEQAENDAFNRRTETLRSFLDGQSGMYQHNMGSIVELVRKSQGMNQAAMASSFATILSSTATYSKKAFKLNQAFAIGDAIVSAYQGISRTLATYPFPISAAMAAAQGAMAFAQVRAIKAQSFGGGGGATGSVGSVSAPSVPALPGAANGGSGQQSQAVTINLEGEVFGREQIRGLIGQINDAFDDGYTLNLR